MLQALNSMAGVGIKVRDVLIPRGEKKKKRTPKVKDVI
jgi:hypothetical protein